MVKPEDIKYSRLVTTFGESIRDPFLILDENNTILYFNKEASLFFALYEEMKKIETVFDENSSAKIKSIINDLLKRNEPVSDTYHFKLLAGKSFKALLSVTLYKEKNYNYIFCFFKTEENNASAKTAILKSRGIRIDGIIHNKEIEEIINEIKSNFPFTFLGKEKIRRKVNKLNEFFWLKDNEGNFILVNNILAEKYGLKVSQIEGKNESAFIPAFIFNFYEAVEKYIRDGNSIIIEGIPLRGIPGIENLQTIEVPLADADNKIIAVAGFTQKASEISKTGEKDSGKKYIENIPLSFVFIDDKLKIKLIGEKFPFEKLTGLKKNSELINRNYKEIFPLELTEKIEKFAASAENNDEFKIKLKGFSNQLNFKLQKHDNEKRENGIYLVIEEIIPESNDTSVRGNMFDSLIQNIPEPVFIYDKENLAFLNVNSAALKLYGYTREEFLKMDLTDLYTPEDIQSLLDNSNTSAGEAGFYGPYRQLKKNGSIILVEISKINIEYEGKNSVYNIVRDVSEKEELIISNQLFKAAFDNTGDLLFTTDSSGFISYINKKAEEVINVKKDSVMNSSFASLVKDEQRGGINTRIFQSNLKEVLNTVVDLKSGKNFIKTELIVSPVLNYKNEVASYTIVGRIIEKTAPDKADESKMETAVNQENIEPNIINPELLSGIFHEILTPINVILGFVQEITEGIENLSPEQQEAAAIISQNRNKLLNTMNSVIELSSLENKINPEVIGITEILDSIQDDFENISTENKVEFSYGRISSSLKFETDKEKFRNLILILFKIIVRLSDEDKIYFSAYQSEENSFVVSFKDNYSSSSGKLLSNIKKVFGEEAGKNYGVSRLNLTHAKKLIEILKGKFDLFKKENEEEDYQFIFPLKLSAVESGISALKEEKMEMQNNKQKPLKEKEWENISSDMRKTISPKPAIKAAEEQGKKKVIIPEVNRKEPPVETSKEKEFKINKLTCFYIEDQIDSQLLFKTQMKDLKEIQFASDFEEAISTLKAIHFDFLVMDINLPGDYNGLDALRIVRRFPGYDSVPVIAVSAYMLPGDKEKFIAAGFTDFIAKPIFREKMIESLEKIFSLSVGA